MKVKLAKAVCSLGVWGLYQARTKAYLVHLLNSFFFEVFGGFSRQSSVVLQYSFKCGKITAWKID